MATAVLPAGGIAVDGAAAQAGGTAGLLICPTVPAKSTRRFSPERLTGDRNRHGT